MEKRTKKQVEKSRKKDVKFAKKKRSEKRRKNQFEILRIVLKKRTLEFQFFFA